MKKRHVKSLMFIVILLVFFICLQSNIVIANEIPVTDDTTAEHIDLRFRSADFDENARVTAIVNGKRIGMYLEPGMDGGMKEYRAVSNSDSKNISLNSEIEFEVENKVDGETVTKTTGILSKDINYDAYQRCFKEHWSINTLDLVGMDFIFSYEGGFISGLKYEVRSFYSDENGTYPNKPEFTDKREGFAGSEVHLRDKDYIPKKDNYVYDGIKTVETNKISGILSSDNTDDNPLVLEVYFIKKPPKDNFYEVRWYNSENGEEIRPNSLRTDKVGKEVSVTEQDKNIEGYIFDANNPNNITIDIVKDNVTITLKLYFIPIPNKTEEVNIPKKELPKDNQTQILQICQNNIPKTGDLTSIIFGAIFVIIFVGILVVVILKVTKRK